MSIVEVILENDVTSAINQLQNEIQSLKKQVDVIRQRAKPTLGETLKHISISYAFMILIVYPIVFRRTEIYSNIGLALKQLSTVLVKLITVVGHYLSIAGSKLLPVFTSFTKTILSWLSLHPGLIATAIGIIAIVSIIFILSARKPDIQSKLRPLGNIKKEAIGNSSFIKWLLKVFSIIIKKVKIVGKIALQLIKIIIDIVKFLAVYIYKILKNKQINLKGGI